MSQLKNLQPERVFYYFEEICKIPHGSQNTKAIADFCQGFAVENNLKYVRDNADNVIIYKNGTEGYENEEPVILQGHTDMVCQKTADSETDFLKEGVKPYVDGEFIKAESTTLGADNGIAVAMILAILENNSYAHPPIEAVFTTDEEIGMIGALQLDMSLLKGKRMINMDSEEDDSLTVSCAGGRDFAVTLPVTREKVTSTRVDIVLSGLQGGHSGVEIHKGRVNGDILAGRILNHMKSLFDFKIISVEGGNKSNAIVNLTEISLCVDEADAFLEALNGFLREVKSELVSREPGFKWSVNKGDTGEYSIVSERYANDIIFLLACSPQGVVNMSKEIEGLVETSMNLGILKTDDSSIYIQYSFRSNKKTAIDFLEERMRTLLNFVDCSIETFGDYPSWSFNPHSALQKLYKECYKKYFTKELKVEAIHAGLECGVFDSFIRGLDCISVGPDMFDVHTVNERLSVKSTEKIFNVIIEVLKNMKKD